VSYIYAYKLLKWEWKWEVEVEVEWDKSVSNGRVKGLINSRIAVIRCGHKER
jgi:hypothetical protein